VHSTRLASVLDSPLLNNPICSSVDNAFNEQAFALHHALNEQTKLAFAVDGAFDKQIDHAFTLEFSAFDGQTNPAFALLSGDFI
jgi:peroxiredoxin